MKIAFIVDEKNLHSSKWIKYFEAYNDVYFIKLKKTKFKFLDVAINIFSMKNQIKKINPDILHAHYAGVNGVLGAMSGFHPYVVTAWGSDILVNSKKKLIRPLLKFALDRADLITCDAHHMIKAIEDLGIDKKKLMIICFGIDTKRFSPGLKDEKLKNELNTIDGKTIISLRNFKPIYDIETLIKAIPLILKEVPDARFLLGGNGPEENILKSLAESLGVKDSIRFLGRIENTDLPRYLNISDIYVSTSLSDAGISASTAEAMACGLPVVITDSGENRLWVKDEKDGFVIPVKSPEILAGKIVYLIKNENIRKMFGANARNVIKEKNDYYREMAKMEECYKNLNKD